MIRLTRLNHKPLVLNSDLIEHIEVTPDTVVSMATGNKFMVTESAQEIVEKVLEFRRAAGAAWLSGPHVMGAGGACVDAAPDVETTRENG